jgi:uncharacterized membrane protein
MTDRPVFIYAATYRTHTDAVTDYLALRDLHHDELLGSYDVALITKDPDGRVHIQKREKPTQHGAWTGAAVGAVVGILFPPSAVGAAVIGAGAGGLIGHLARGMSRHDMDALGELLDDGQAALILIGQSRAGERLEKHLTRAHRSVEREIDADRDELERELKAAAGQAIGAG